MARSRLLRGHVILLFSLFFLIIPSLSSAQICPDSDNDGFTDIACGGTDCDDTDNHVFPGATRICDGKDSNCDGRLDFSADVDNDNDGYPKCAECNDLNPAINPGATEGPVGDPSCFDGLDNDCDGWFDIGQAACNDPCLDSDGDGFYDINSDPTCAQPRDDCDDSNANIYPGAADTICDGVDDNCDGTTDDGYMPTPTNCGIGECANTGFDQCVNGAIVDDCTPGAPGTEEPPGDPTCSDGLDNDCDGDTDYPADLGCHDCVPTGPDDNCDGVDNDCDGTPDDEYVTTPTNCGVGVCASSGQLECQSGAVADTCVENLQQYAPGVDPYDPLYCTDGLDNDCNNVVDVDVIECPPSCIDFDGDGWGNPGDPSCPSGSTTDCDDTDNQVFPGAIRICDGKDSNCDGRLDFNADVDNDNDGYPICAGDCNDNNPNTNPASIEGPPADPTCYDGLDNDCDGFFDVGDNNGIPNCVSWNGNCTIRTEPKNGPHIFDLMDPGIDPLDPADDVLIRTSCQWCHTDATGTIDQQLDCQRCHADWNDPSDPLNGVLKDPSNPIAYPLDPPYGFATAPNVKTHLNDTVSPVTAPDCITCHNPHLQEQDVLHGTTYGKMIKEFICYDETALGNRVEELIVFTAPTGIGSFADGPPHNENICEICHTQTTYHRNDGSTPVHNDSTNCTNCHLHSDGFQPVARSPHNTDYFNSNCELCHVNTQGTIDFIATIPNQKCNNCHGERRPHTSNPLSNPLASGNYSYDILCVDCHDPMLLVGNNRKLIRQSISMSIIPNSNILNTTIRGAESLADGDPRNENICETCHSLTSHNRGDGSGNGIHLDGIDYDGYYCMICHDHNKSFMTMGNTCLEENEPGVICTP